MFQHEFRSTDDRCFQETARDVCKFGTSRCQTRAHRLNSCKLFGKLEIRLIPTLLGQEIRVTKMWTPQIGSHFRQRFFSATNRITQEILHRMFNSRLLRCTTTTILNMHLITACSMALAIRRSIQLGYPAEGRDNPQVWALNTSGGVYRGSMYKLPPQTGTCLEAGKRALPLICRKSLLPQQRQYPPTIQRYHGLH